MLVIAALVGSGCGLLLVAMSLALLGAAREVPSPSPGAHVAARGAAGVLVVGALLAWGSGLPALEALLGVAGEGALEGPVLSLTLMAALAIPLRVIAPRRSAWGSALLYVPAWLLALVALGWIAVRGGSDVGGDWITPIRFSLAVCGGLGARAVGQSLQLMVADATRVEWPGTVTCALLTALTGAAGLVNLGQRGMLWAGADAVLRGGLAGAWLAWTADWLTPRRHRRLRPLLTVVAGVLLVLTAVKPS